MQPRHLDGSGGSGPTSISIAGPTDRLASSSSECFWRLSQAIPYSAPFELGEAQAAVESFSRGLEFAPEDAGLRYGLGLALQAAGDASGAREAFHATLASGQSLSESERAALQKALADLEPERTPSDP